MKISTGQGCSRQPCGQGAICQETLGGRPVCRCVKILFITLYKILSQPRPGHYRKNPNFYITIFTIVFGPSLGLCLLAAAD